MLENYQITHYPRFSFIPEPDIAFPKTGELFLLRGVSSICCTICQATADIASSLINHSFFLIFSGRRFKTEFEHAVPLPYVFEQRAADDRRV